MSILGWGSQYQTHSWRWHGRRTNLVYSLSTIAYLGSIQTGRANVKSTASLLYTIFDATRPVWMRRLTCVPKPAHRVLRRQVEATAASLNRPLGSIQIGRANVKPTASLLYENYNAVRPVWVFRLKNMCSKTSASCFTPWNRRRGV